MKSSATQERAADVTVLQETLLMQLDLPSPHRPYYGHMTPELYATGGHMLMSPDVYPPNGYTARVPNDQHPNNNYLPSVSYSLDHLDRLDYQVPSCHLILAQLTIFFTFVYLDRFSRFSTSCVSSPGSRDVVLPTQF